MVARHRDDVLTWTLPEQWHLTLAFYGQVEDDASARPERPVSPGRRSDTRSCHLPWTAPAVSTSGPCGSVAAAMSPHCAASLDQWRQPGVGLAPPRRRRLFDSALTSHWPVPAARWTYGRTSLRSMLIEVGHGTWTPSRWCVPTWAQAPSDGPGTKSCRRIHLAPDDLGGSPAIGAYNPESPCPAMSGIGSEEDCAAGALSSPPLSPVLGSGSSSEP